MVQVSREKKAVVTVLIFIGLFTACIGSSSAGPPRLKFLFSLGAPGSDLEFAQPQRIFLDGKFHEYYITDTGHNRIVILDQRGFYLFEIGDNDKLQFPLDVVVDTSGYILVLSNSFKDEPIQVFDYNGEYLHPFRFLGGPDSKNLVICSMTIDPRNNYYLADAAGKRILVYNQAEEFQFEFPLFHDNEADASNEEQEIGSIYYGNDHLYVPIPMMGMVCSYTSDGTFDKTFGNLGDGFGELSFPISVATMNSGIVVLDKHRHTLIVYDNSGIPKAEFGGMGIEPGWFYHPVSLLVDDQNRAWVAQGLDNLVQILQLPTVDEPATLTEENKTVIKQR
ncbi:MAG: NHL repeat-containing protein [bacterium]|nr:NHL repeat-containing protein [bacterium]